MNSAGKSIILLHSIVPGVITEIIIVGQYVIWQPPTERNGVIIGYDIKVCQGELCSNHSFGPATFLYQVQSTDIQNRTLAASFQVSIPVKNIYKYCLNVIVITSEQ